ncbi:MAG TPA: permease [Bacteroidales bacterium]|nr:permease [Bacteroidales bacterium]HPJ60671.1 permease [Bacteroidales bacterium]HPR13522.1 permease [Bacteroidales bacterium]HRW85210.1 permease [Bacteroidales bacterium]
MRLLDIANKKIVLSLVLLPVWFLVYHYLQPATDWLIDDILGMTAGSHLTETLRFFVFEVPKVLMLLILIIFLVGIVRSYFSPEKTRKALEGKSLFTGNVLASMLGIVTPFCSCSAIPLFLGFVEAGIPIGVTFSFLIASPMINEVAIVLLFGLFGWKTAAIYIVSGLVIAIIAGWIIGKLNLRHWVQDWVYQSQFGNSDSENEKLKFSDRIGYGYNAVKEIVGKIWIYVVIGIAVGAGAHGYIPEDYMAALMGKSAWYSIPLSVIIGVPLYSNAAGIIPIVSVLIEKGAALGTALAFMMAVIGLSLPEMIILKKVLKIPFILTFAGIMAVGIVLVGFIFNYLVFL